MCCAWEGLLTAFCKPYLVVVLSWEWCFGDFVQKEAKGGGRRGGGGSSVPYELFSQRQTLLNVTPQCCSPRGTNLWPFHATGLNHRSSCFDWSEVVE